MGLFGFGKKPQPVDRYAGKPFLKLVDSFVLKAIGELDPSQESLLVQMTPKFQETFACSGSWEEIVISQLQFPPIFANPSKPYGAKIKVSPSKMACRSHQCSLSKCSSPTMSLPPNIAVKAAPFGRWTLRDKASRSAPYLQR